MSVLIVYRFNRGDRMIHFSIAEFDCPDCGKNNMDELFLEMLDVARNIAGVPFVINSGCRCHKHNREVGGSEGSSHLSGNAADISCSNSTDRIKIVRACIQAGFNRIGVGSIFIHVDNSMDKNEAMWKY